MNQNQFIAKLIILLMLASGAVYAEPDLNYELVPPKLSVRVDIYNVADKTNREYKAVLRDQSPYVTKTIELEAAKQQQIRFTDIHQTQLTMQLTSNNRSSEFNISLNKADGELISNINNIPMNSDYLFALNINQTKQLIKISSAQQSSNSKNYQTLFDAHSSASQLEKNSISSPYNFNQVIGLLHDNRGCYNGDLLSGTIFGSSNFSSSGETVNSHIKSGFDFINNEQAIFVIVEIKSEMRRAHRRGKILYALNIKRGADDTVQITTIENTPRVKSGTARQNIMPSLTQLLQTSNTGVCF